jgi:hypothetical protein
MGWKISKVTYRLNKIPIKISVLSWALAAHACNLNDQEDQDSKTAGANSTQDPILKKPFTK